MDLDADSQASQVKKEQVKEKQDQEDLTVIEKVEEVTIKKHSLLRGILCIRSQSLPFHLLNTLLGVGDSLLRRLL